MHSWELAELAAQLAICGDRLRDAAWPLNSEAQGECWIASKCRLDRWNRALKTQRSTCTPKRRRRSQQLGVVCQEILTSEILSRVWASVASAADEFHGTREAGPLAVNVLSAHVEATNRVLSLLAAGFTPIHAFRKDLNRLRRQSQRWTDLLLGRFGWAPGIAQFAHDAARAADFADDFSEKGSHLATTPSWKLLLVALQSTFRDGRTIAANPDLNARIASAILRCLPEEANDHFDGSSGLWQLRLVEAASDTERLLSELLEAAAPAATELSA